MEWENQWDSEHNVESRRPTFQAFDKPLRSQDSIHVPGHILMPLSSLMAHPYPGAVHPFENQQGERSVSDIRSISDSQWSTASPALWNQTRISFSTPDLENAFPTAIIKDRRRCSLAIIGGEHAKRPLIVAALPILPLQAAIVCLIFNILIPGLGKLLLIMLFCLNLERMFIVVWWGIIHI